MSHKAILVAVALTCAAALAPGAPAASFICGGVSQPEAETLKAQARDHDLMLKFAETGGAHLADVDVQISDSRGRVVLSGTCDGPIMLVDLPGAGSWRVSATSNGQTRQKTIATGRGRTARATLLWPATP